MNIDNDIDVIDMINASFIGSDLAKKIGLSSRFFSYIKRDKIKSLNNEIIIWLSGGLVMVRVPIHISKMIHDEDYIKFKIMEDKDALLCDHVFKITKGTKIGFYK